MKISEIGMITLLSFITSIGIITPNICAAGPSISGYSGTVEHGQIITVNGSNFGVKNPVTPALWDTVSYSELRNGDAVPVGKNNLWPETAGGKAVFYKTSNPRGKWTAHYSNEWSTNQYKKAAIGGFIVSEVSTSKKLYITWWNYVSGDPTVGNTNASNKWIRLICQGGWGTVGEGYIIWEPRMSHAKAVTAEGINMVAGAWHDWGGSYPAWNRMEVFVDSTSATNSPIYKLWTNGTQVASYASSTAQKWVIQQIGNIGFDGSNSAAALQPTVDFGEIYADNTPARVEICSGSTWATRSHCEIQIPTTQWIDGRLKIQVNQGSFANDAKAYLYVVDSKGIASKGKKIRFGQK
jgi:hypothetical protein